MSFTFRPAKREGVPLLLGVAGGTGSGKTFSALRMAKGLAGDVPFCVIDTEARRALHYADAFKFYHGELIAPFTPSRYAEAIIAADDAKYPVIVVDSMSHEHAGDGGILDMQEAEFKRLGANNTVKMLSWAAPKMEHRKMVSKLLQLRAHLILCFRAEEKIEMVKGPNGMEVRKKVTATGLDGWVPISEKNLPYELTASFLLMASSPGIPLPIKLQQQHRPMVDLGKPLDETAGRLLGEWARGASPTIVALPILAEPGRPAEPDSGYVAEERRAWLAQIEKASHDLDNDTKRALWKTHCGTATKLNADPASLEALHAAIVTRKSA